MSTPARQTLLAYYRRRRDAWMVQAREAARWRDLLTALGEQQLAHERARQAVEYVRLARLNQRALTRAQLGKAAPVVATGGKCRDVH